MKKNMKLNSWLWKWHFIAGIISLPFIIILSISGGWYLFKDHIEQPEIEKVTLLEDTGKTISYQQQWENAQKATIEHLNTIVLPQKNHATEFISGRFSNTLQSVYVNPNNGNVLNKRVVRNTFMYKVRKLHGELLMGSFGTKIVELIASWMVVLIITGIYVWWPRRSFKNKGTLSVRTTNGKRTLFRDLHAVTAFWVSTLLLMILAGGLPWTDVFGHNYKWFQETTHTGYPKTWENQNFHSKIQGKPLPLDSIVNIAEHLNLPGKVTITLPKNKNAVYSIKNETVVLTNQKAIQVDQYSGKIISQDVWKNVGVMMRSRMWLMNFHQGKFGTWNLLLMLFAAIALTFISVSALVSYLLRKPKGEWGIPPVSKQFYVGKGIFILIIILGILLPLFGISVILIYGFNLLKRNPA
ncbi:PepSY-associated TM helix domain-containing protein [Zhouia sp. PK063]|uniref:PepSY-associated TM helix domain-containing protein n=1 Tax=Zhouia sp. PK063 TaxID=3373602 RepID=UPI0037B943C4